MSTNAFRKLIFLTFAALLAHVAFVTASQAKLISQIGGHEPGQILVKLKDTHATLSAQALMISSIIKKLGAGAVLSAHPLQTDKNLQVIRLAKTSDDALNAALGVLAKNEQVQYAEPNYTVHALDDGVPNDPDFYKSWGMKNTGQKDPGGVTGIAGADINILPLWKEGITGSKKVVVAIIDTGVDWNHPDLQANIYTNPGEIAGNGLDNDHNGFVQDIHGWNFYDGNNNSRDVNDHGTHCAGTIGAVGNNGEGTAGVNWNVSLMPIRFLGPDGSGSMDKAVEAINYATMMKVNVTSNSWGGGSFSQSMSDAIDHARQAGILFVVAAGNEAQNIDERQSYPASYGVDNVLTVGATDNHDALGIFSNYGEHAVHVAAPGVRIWGPVRDGGYASMSGTSMATPFAAGIAALILSVHPDASYSEIKERMIRTSTPVPGLVGKVQARGRLNAYNAVHDSGN